MDNILNKKECGWKNLSDSEMNKVLDFSDGYIKFLNRSKTEREANKNIISELQEKGFKDINSVDSLKPLDKVYFNNRGKSVFAAVIGNERVENGLNIVGAHIDSPRLDLKPNPVYEDSKPNPLYEDSELAYFKTHYYGGIKKYQWTTIPLAIHGVIVKTTGEKIYINIGEDDNDPVVGISDLLIHRSLGFDNSMVASYGQDDRVCAYGTLKAIVDCTTTEYTNVAIFADKEEIGSVGNTGMYSEMFDNFIHMLLEKTGSASPSSLNRTYCNSRMLSADVGAGVDPNYQDVSEVNNSSYIGYGVELNKYTGSRGKSGASDANAEFVAYVRSVFEKNNVKYQVSELGKVDIGGGGTIAYILANKGIDVIDCGVPVISMHSPYEVTSKYDIYSAYSGYRAFFESNDKVNY